MGSLSLSQPSSEADLSAQLSSLGEITEDISKKGVAKKNIAEKGVAETSQATVIHKIETQVALTPNEIALVAQTEPLTYQQLNQRVNQLAHFLQQQGVGAGSLVAIQLMRSPDAIIAFLAVMKAGAAYIPIDPSYPQARRRYILQDSQAAVLLTESSLYKTDLIEPNQLCLSIQIDTQRDIIAQHSTANLDIEINLDDIAYVIYTSGTTGHPKGVMIRHEGLINHAMAIARAFQMTASDRMLQFSNLSFDIIVEEIYPTLITGAALVLRPEDIATSMSRFFQFTAAEKITILDLPTAFWHELVGELARRLKPLSEIAQNRSHNSSQETSQNRETAIDDTNPLSPSIRLVVVGGEEASLARYRQWRSMVGDYPRWLNTYGPTETTVSATLYDPIAENFDLTHKLPIGRAIDNVQTYVLKPTKDQKGLQLVEPGEPGKLYIGGPGLAQRYLNKPDKTATAFVDHPFAAGDRLYDTGDIVRELPDGNLIFIGRADFQVKIRGFRIELGEVARCLEEYPLIQQQVVLVREDRPEEKRLVAYVMPHTAHHTAQKDKVLDIGALRSFMEAKLPDYMVPSAFVVLETLPTTANGKIDRSALLALPAPVCQQVCYVPPETEIEKTLVRFWQQLLSIKTVGVNDNFFELGGSSLMAVRLFSFVEEAFGQKLPLTALLQSPTPAKLARMIETIQSSDHSSASSSNNHPDLWESLVPMQTKGCKPPIFFLHAVGPSILNYQNLLPYLDDDQPVYALQAKGINRERPLLEHMEKMAAEYIQDIKSIQPHGPYHFAGHSFGGLMAFEMAHQLIKQGETIEFLGLFDAATPTLTYCQTPPWVYQLYIHGLNLSAAQGFYQKWHYLESRAVPIFSKLLQKGLAKFGLATLPVMEPLPEIYRRIEEVDRAALKRYAPQPYPSKITLFRAQEKDPKQFHDDLLGWRYLAEGGIEIYDVPGHHLSLMLEPQVATLAKLLQVCLNKAYSDESFDILVP